jgi:hypothetical protein
MIAADQLQPVKEKSRVMTSVSGKDFIRGRNAAVLLKVPRKCLVRCKE